jgi:hypothetical protein
MMVTRKTYAQIMPVFLILLASCIEPYSPPEIEAIENILVVDGFINISDNTASVRLTQAAALSDGATSYPELNATVMVEDENGSTFFLTEQGDGNYYTSGTINLDITKKYRLHVTTGGQKQYFSDYIEVKATASIDSITWRPTDRRDGINIYVNSHDDNPENIYYQWTFQETWEYTAGNYSMYKLVDGEVELNTQNLYMCWLSKPSTEINIASTEHLSGNLVRDYQLVFIPKGAEKISRKYSILVEQRNLTKEAFDFWTQLKKTTENLGTLFDPLPSQVLGNLHSQTDSNEPVLGYFSGGSVSKKRIFIEIGDLPPDLRRSSPPPCAIEQIPNDQLSGSPDMLLIGTYGVPFVEGYTYSTGKNCMDCRDNGGVTSRPDYWD